MPIKVDRTPYTVTYYQGGEKKTLRRVPPQVRHDIMPGDKVSVTHKKSEHWDVDQEASATTITNRQPNTIRIKKDDGTYTYMSHLDLQREKQGPISIKQEEENDPIGHKYLLWP